ncbi:response regulator [Vallitalea pronyensis]|uniref:Stage 0 sporulation protein A homolog n=1 Tax=Vallitalea pronyensis TaxID=1348613 RepID=A0A8J8SJD4_9FIRM|nr:response regulator [Vallitalea pronyensis]QUI25362.1 response regulator [Vallitalea pronyensis]
MYSLIIVDDEYISRNGLRQIIDWQSLGFSVKGIFEDGKDAMEYLKGNPVDVILTDIRMANVSGLDLAQYVKEHCPDVEVVFMSAYREFEYAQSAIRLNVFNYVIKPIAVSEITHVFNSLFKKLESFRQQTQKNDHYMALLKELKQEIFIGVSMGAINSEEEMSKRIKKIDKHMELEGTPCGLINMTLDEKTVERFLNEIWIYGVDTMSTALSNFLNFEENQLEYYVLSQMKTKTELFAISKGVMEESVFKDLLKRETHKASNNIKSFLGLDVKFTTPVCYSNAYRYLRAVNEEQIQEIEPISNKESFDESLFKNQENMLFTYLMSGETNLCRTLFMKMLRRLDGLGIQGIRNYFVSLMIKLDEQNLLPDNYKVSVVHSTIDYSQLFDLTSIDDFYHWGLVLFDQISTDYLHSDEEGVNLLHKATINKAKGYINEHVYSDISLNEVADYVHLSPVYFSRLFKEVEGMNYINYIVAARIKKSQELLKNPSLKIYEISEMVGYQNVRYFYKIYKNFTGETPTQYRKKCR